MLFKSYYNKERKCKEQYTSHYINPKVEKYNNQLSLTPPFSLAVSALISQPAKLSTIQVKNWYTFKAKQGYKPFEGKKWANFYMYNWKNIYEEIAKLYIGRDITRYVVQELLKSDVPIIRTDSKCVSNWNKMLIFSNKKLKNKKYNSLYDQVTTTTSSGSPLLHPLSITPYMSPLVLLCQIFWNDIKFVDIIYRSQQSFTKKIGLFWKFQIFL